MEQIDFRVSNQWEAQPDEELKIPEAYIKNLEYEVVVFTKRRDFTFRCKDYSPRSVESAWTFTNVVIDTSKKDSNGETTLRRLTYHSEISLVNVGFMVIPAPEDEAWL